MSTRKLPAVFIVSDRLSAVVITIQRASSNPRLTRGFHPPTTRGMTSDAIVLPTNAHLSRTARSGKLAFFHRAIGPTPTRNISGVMIATKTVLKYGGPTDSFPLPRTSMNRGYNVPSSTEAAATASNTLLDSNNDSREITSKVPAGPALPARAAYSRSEPPTTIPRKHRRKTPRFGSVAKACTDVNTPDRTRNAPNRLKRRPR